MAVITDEKCNKCKKGYLVEEVSITAKETNYYCNSCFKYKEKPKPSPKLPKNVNIFGGIGLGYGLGNFSDEEVDRLLEDLGVFSQD